MVEEDAANWAEKGRLFSFVIAGGCPRQQVKAVYEFARLSKNAPDSALFFSVPVLVDLFRSSDPSIHEAATFALCRLARRPGAPFCPIIGQNGAIPLILELLPESRYQFRKPLLRLLSALVAFDGPNRATLARSRGLSIILEFANSFYDDTRKPLMEILSAMAMQRKLRRIFSNIGALKFLIEALSLGRMLSRIQAAHAIGLLGVVKMVRRMLVDSGAIPALLQLIREGDQSAKITAGNALGIISSHVDCIHPLAEAGAIPLYIELLECPEPLGRDIAEDVLSILAIMEENATVIAKQLVRILHCHDEDTKLSALSLMLDIAGYKHSIPIVRKSGAIPLLVEALSNENIDIRLKVMGTVVQISCNEADRRALAESGGIPILTDLLKGDSEAVRDCVVEALMHFSEDPEFREQVADALENPSFFDAMNRSRSLDEYASSSLNRLCAELLLSDPDLF